MVLTISDGVCTNYVITPWILEESELQSGWTFTSHAKRSLNYRGNEIRHTYT